MISKPRRHCRSALSSKSSMCPQEIVATAYQPHTRLQRRPFVCPGASPAYQWRQPSSEGGIQPLDVGSVDQRSYRVLGTYHPGDHLRLSTHYYDVAHYFHHPPTLVTLYDPGNHYSSRQHQPRTASLAGAKRLSEKLQSLAFVAGEPVGYQQDTPFGSTSAHSNQ